MHINTKRILRFNEDVFVSDPKFRVRSSYSTSNFFSDYSPQEQLGNFTRHLSERIIIYFNLFIKMFTVSHSWERVKNHTDNLKIIFQ